MNNQKDDTIRIVRGEDRFVGSPNKDVLLNVKLEGEQKNLIEGDRTTIISLQEKFDEERQSSTSFRIAGKITSIFNNDVEVTTSYEPFENNLYYINANQSALNEIESPGNGVWTGFPQYNEFTFFRTESISGHTGYVTKSAGTYNWATYLSYPFENYENQIIKHRVDFIVNQQPQYIINSFQVNEGVPYYIINRLENGKRLITFYCGYKHNLQIGDWIYTNNVIAGKRFFEVYDLGDVAYGNEEKVFSIFDYGYQDPLFGNYSIGTFKRVIDVNNSGETMSKYYVRRHKILTTLDNIELTKMGFENNPFPVVKQLEYSALTPNFVERVSERQGTQSFGYSFDKDIDISPLRDNLNRPITKLFVTIVNKGYMGWFNNPWLPNNNTGIQVGWDLNFLSKGIDSWWDINNFDNRDTIPNGSYQINGETFYYNSDFKTGDTLSGGICEFNDWEQKEIELSPISHKISFNPQILFNNSEPNLPNGYTYKPHYEINLRVFSDYIEKGDKDKVDLIPDYSFLSYYEQEWRWRDLYPYGYVDSDGNGVDIPFMNGNHYPFKEILFLISPMEKDLNNNNNLIFPPITDDCE